LGDNNYPDGAADTIDENIGQYYHEYIYPYAGEYGEGSDINRFFPTLGNHDWISGGARPYFDYFTLPGNERYYDFVWGPVHFFALDSDFEEPDGVGRSSLQAQWLQERLAASTLPWQVVYFHHAPYSSAYHGNSYWMQWPFKDWGADVVLAGHDHVYERLEIDGLPYFTNGAGGGPRYYFGLNPLEESRVRFREDYGAMLVEATESSLKFVFETQAHEIIDAYQIGAEPQVEEPASSSVQVFPDPEGYRWELVAEGLSSPVGVTHAGDGSGRLFVIEQAGTIRIVQDSQVLSNPFLDIHERVNDDGNERGLLGLAFHPNYAENGYFFVNYTGDSGDTFISRFQVSADPSQADPGSEKVLLRIGQPFPNHNGGHLVFGPDGYLYIGTGDGGSGGDPQGNAQNPNTLLGKLLRIDVDFGDPYTIPVDNPADGGRQSEIWASGLRNPWRFSFDRLTGDLYVGDVGQNQWEEIDFLEAGSSPGANFGWDYWEGFHPFEGSPPSDLAPIIPIWEYDHSLGCSVTGGVVYRGSLPDWQGIYLYGDFCSGYVWGLLMDSDGSWQNQLLFETNANITSFGEDQTGEVYLVNRSGILYRLVEK
jgi:glucose/arabinose dehydrogenase